jgi:phage baseplate assembly protein W
MATSQKIYADLDLTFNKVPGTKDVAVSYNDQAVIRSVRHLLLTNFYERPFQSNLGSNLNKLLFEPFNNITAGLLQNEIINVINNFEPRVEIDTVEVIADEDRNTFIAKMTFFIGNNSAPTSINMLLQRSR